MKSTDKHAPLGVHGARAASITSRRVSAHLAVGAVALASAQGVRAETPYWGETEMVTPQHEYRKEFFDSVQGAQLACEKYVSDLGWDPAYCNLSGGPVPNSTSWSAGWLCEGPGSPTNCNSPIYFHYYRMSACSPETARYDPATNTCVPWRDRFHDKVPPSCPSFGRPIHPLTGSKRNVVALGDVLAGLSLDLVYDTRSKVPSNDASLTFKPAPAASFGALWSSSVHKRLVIHSGTSSTIQAARGRGGWVSFARDTAGNYKPDADVFDTVRSNGSGWRYVEAASGAVEDYDSTGKLLTISFANGRKLTYAYSTGVVAGESPTAGLLIGVSDGFGRPVKFHYEQPAGVTAPRIYKVIASDAQEILVGYDNANNLASLTWPGGKVKTFLYERTDLPWALTGVVDEKGKRNVTYDYDAQGRAIDTQAAGGVEHYHASWTSAPSWQITQTYDPVANVVWRDHTWTWPQGLQVQGAFGQTVTLETSVINGVPRVTRRSQPGGSGCGASDSWLSYDSLGNVTSKVDFNHVRSCHAYAAERGTETFRIEGMAEAEACPADLASHQVSAGATQRKVSTRWHPLRMLEAQRAEPKRITTTVYNGQKDPIKNDGLDVICAPSAPPQPDGTKIAVVCTRYEQSTEDETGNLGFAAVVKETRQWSYTYDQYGQVKTEIDPRGKVTTYDYWDGTSFTDDGRGHWLGDLKTVTNALNQATEHLEYNKRGQPLTIKYANGSQELREYHVRGWLSKVTLVPAGSGVSQVTQYDYHDTGLLKKVTQPDGSFASYTWDGAHRLTEVLDSLGNKVTYKLDNAGNRETETFTDKNGVLAKTISRTFDALGRMASSTGLQ